MRAFQTERWRAMSTIREILMHIQTSEAFDLLEPYREASVWKDLSRENRLLLARLLVLQGARQLAQGQQQVLDSFEMANQIAAHAPEILYQQAEVLSNYRDNIRCLILAAQSLAHALQQYPQLFEGWYLQAKVLTDIGRFENSPARFLEAHQAYERAASLWRPEETIEWGNLCWAWGNCLASLSHVSGEPSDMHQAIVKYRLAYEAGCRVVDFLNDFGQGYVNLALLLENPAYFTEALNLFNQAVREEPTAFDGWYHQACCLQNFMKLVGHVKLLEQADHSFGKAAEIDPSHSRLWLKWGELDTTLGRLKRDKQKLESSLVKLSKAHELEPDHPNILSSWSEAEMILGVQEERLDLLQGARAKILRSLDIESNDPDSWYLYGACLNELGGYFGEAGYHEEAIEKFRYGLSLDKRHPLLFYGMALSHFALGELREDLTCFEQAVRCFGRVVECGGAGFPQFWNDWGVALMKLAEITEQPHFVEMAIEKFEIGLKQPIQDEEGDEVDLEWVYNYGAACDLMGDLKDEPTYFEKAVQIFTHVLQIDPDYQQVRYHLALTLSHLADALCDVECYFRSIGLFQSLLEEDPEDEVVHLDIGMSLTNLALLVRDPHYPERFHTLCGQAEHHFMQAAALGSLQAYYQLAGIYSIMGHYDQAMHYLERAQFYDALPEVADLLHDEWLENIRQLPVFQEFINRPFA